MTASDLVSLSVGRRRFLAGCAAGTLGVSKIGAAGAAIQNSSIQTSALDALPLSAQLLPTNPDVVIVGAGAAGLAAAWALAKRGTPFVVVEASGSIGGRAMTDRHTFGTPFDAGCAWIYQADHNPLTAIARRHGFDLLQHDAAPERLYSEIGRSTASAKLRYADAGRRLTLNLRGLGSTGRDVPAAVAMAKPPDGWDRLAANWIGPLDTGADMDEFSAVDWWNLDLTWPYFLVKQGYGSVIASFGEGIPVRTSTTVSAIHWGDAEGVRVETSGGTIRAKACIITVSTGVLRAERIRFDPPLPPEKISAIDGLPMGLLAKIPLQFDGARFGLPANGWLSYSADSEEIASFLTWPFDNNLIIGFVGGRFAWELTGAGEEVAIDFALTQLRKILGSTVDQHFVKGAFTRWGRNPNVMGAFAYARPGAALARDALAQPLNNRLWFAGEALGGGMAMTCGGAFASGLRVEADVSKWVIDTKRLYGRRMVGDEVVALPL